MSSENTGNLPASAADGDGWNPAPSDSDVREVFVRVDPDLDREAYRRKAAATATAKDGDGPHGKHAKHAAPPADPAPEAVDTVEAAEPAEPVLRPSRAAAPAGTGQSDEARMRAEMARRRRAASGRQQSTGKPARAEKAADDGGAETEAPRRSANKDPKAGANRDPKAAGTGAPRQRSAVQAGSADRKPTKRKSAASAQAKRPSARAEKEARAAQVPRPLYEQPKSHKVRNAIIGVAIAVLLAGGGYLLWNYIAHMHDQTAGTIVNADGDIQKKLDDAVLKSMMTIGVPLLIEVEDGETAKAYGNDGEQISVLDNPETNRVDVRYTVYIKGEDKPIYESGLFHPGEGIMEFKLNRKLEPGNYTIKAVEQGYDTETGGRSGGTVAANVAMVVK